MVPVSAEELSLKSRQLAYVRVAYSLLALVLGMTITSLVQLNISPEKLAIVCTAVAMANLAALWLFRQKMSRTAAQAVNALLLGADILALSAFVHMTRGIESDLFFLYLLPILLASNVYDRTGIFATALAASIAYPTVLTIENWELVMTKGEGLAAAYAQQVGAHIVARGLLLSSVALVWAAFCERMSRVASESGLKLKEQLEANTALLKKLEARSRKEQLSSSVSLSLRRTLELDEILAATCSGLSSALSESHCIFITNLGASQKTRIWDSGSQQPLSSSFLPESLQEYFLSHNWPRHDKMDRLEKFIISDTPFGHADLSQVKQELMALGVSTILLRPIMYGDALKGILIIPSCKGEQRYWTDEELELVDTVAGQVAVAIEHAQLVRELSGSNRELVAKNANLDAKNLELRQMQSQLIQQEKMASLGRIVAGIAHELNNPINFVHGNLPYLKQYVEELRQLIDALAADADAALAERLDALKRKLNYDFLVTDLDNIIADLSDGAERIREIVRNLRSFSRLDEAELKEASIQEGIESTLKILSQYYGRDKIPVHTDFCELPPVLCYPGKLNQVWMNLLANAADAVGAVPNPEVKITTRQENDSVLVAITDNGPGIKGVDQSKIFEPFFTTKPVGKGTGLGLSICHSIIERHGGRIWFESSPGAGTTFQVKIPLKTRSSESEPVLADGVADSG